MMGINEKDDFYQVIRANKKKLARFFDAITLL